MPCPSHPPWLDHSNYTWWRVQVMKFFITEIRMCPYLCARCTIQKAKETTSTYQSTEMKSDSPARPLRVMDCPNFPRTTRVSVILAARLPLSPVAQLLHIYQATRYHKPEDHNMNI
jgi:hypothetical protein